MIEIVSVSDLAGALGKGSEWDAVVLVAPRLTEIDEPALQQPIAALRAIDAGLDDTTQLVAAAGLAGGRLILAPTGRLDRDRDDVRRFAAAARQGLLRARDAGATRPLLVVAQVPGAFDFCQAPSVAALAALAGQWQPLEAREARGEAECEPLERLGVAVLDGSFDAAAARWVAAVEGGRRLARDLAGTEPERMAPPRFAAHCQQVFADLPIDVSVVDDQEEIERSYPLLAAVARASRGVERHHPRIVRLEYVGEGPISRTLLFAGKGVTYDTGGADLKVGGHMAGMSRDKGGAAAVAGLLYAVAHLRPAGVRLVAELGAVRNSVGADAYVSDEILTSHAGVRVRIGNTDAEGRLVLADLLSHLRERALGEPDPRLFTVATLTGHAVRAVGPYSIAIDNRAARQAGVAAALAQTGDLWGDPFEVSRLRPEDWDFIDPRSKADDVLSCNNAASSQTARGHQFPAAFLAIASGLAPHGERGSSRPLAYTHVDIGGSAMEGCDWQHGRPTASPVVTLAAALLSS